MRTTRLCFGLRGVDVDAATHTLASLLAVHASATLQDAGPRGLWVHGSDITLRSTAARWATALGRAVRLYRVDLEPIDDEGLQATTTAVALLPSGDVQPITAVADRNFEPHPGEDLADHATARLAILLEIHEHLDDADSRFVHLESDDD
ncbi:MAG: hypothetical protein KTR31_13100 [Myxococcales bacterium]|nr:hypothetical protein [Myxococcales bacterium]